MEARITSLEVNINDVVCSDGKLLSVRLSELQDKIETALAECSIYRQQNDLGSDLDDIDAPLCGCLDILDLIK